jgi:hypothetical protein
LQTATGYGQCGKIMDMIVDLNPREEKNIEKNITHYGCTQKLIMVL